MQSGSWPCAAIRLETVKTVELSLVLLLAVDFGLLPVDEFAWSPMVGLLSSAESTAGDAELLNVNGLLVVPLDEPPPPSRLTNRLIGPEAACFSLPALVNCVSIVAVRGTRGRLPDACSSLDDDLLAIVWLDV